MDVGPWLAAATAVAGTAATVLVAIFSNRAQLRLAETQRIAEREAREEERNRDRQQREEERAREREAREEEQRREQESSGEAALAARREQRRAAVQALIAQERLRSAHNEMTWGIAGQAELERRAADFMLLTRPHERSLREKVRERVLLEKPPPEWWYPWVSDWISAAEDESVGGFNDGGGFAF